MCKIKMIQDKTTKNKVRFTEVLEGKLTNPVIETLYVPKETLKAMSWKEGRELIIDISVADAPKTTSKRKTAAEKVAKSTASEEKTAKVGKATVKKVGRPKKE